MQKATRTNVVLRNIKWPVGRQRGEERKKKYTGIGSDKMLTGKTEEI